MFSSSVLVLCIQDCRKSPDVSPACKSRTVPAALSSSRPGIHQWFCFQCIHMQTWLETSSYAAFFLAVLLSSYGAACTRLLAALTWFVVVIKLPWLSGSGKPYLSPRFQGAGWLPAWWMSPHHFLNVLQVFCTWRTFAIAFASCHECVRREQYSRPFSVWYCSSL